MLIKNGIVVTASDIFKADVRVQEGRITEIGESLDRVSSQVVDATGLYVMPGGIDVHTHFDLDVGIARATDDFYTGTVAAACGGTTSIVDHIAFGPKGCSLRHQVDVYHELARDKAVIDYGFHGVIQRVDEYILCEMEDLIREGITSYKFYMTYDYKLGDSDVYALMERAKHLGVLLAVHAENDGIINYLRHKFVSEGKTSPQYHPLSRPDFCESESLERVAQMAKNLGNVPLYIVHLSSALGMRAAERARREGEEFLYLETCPQYLLLDDSRYLEENNQGLKYIMSPPLRSKGNGDVLWKGLADRTIQTVGTDHCPFFFESDKQLGAHDFTRCPNGAPGVETRMPLLFSEGVNKGRISLNRFVEITATNPAKLFGLYPKKGTIAIGCDADLVLFDPLKKVSLTKDILHEHVDYTPYEGFELKGYPVMTIARGEIIVRNNTFVGKKGRGQFIKRTLPDWDL